MKATNVNVVKYQPQGLRWERSAGLVSFSPHPPPLALPGICFLVEAPGESNYISITGGQAEPRGDLDGLGRRRAPTCLCCLRPALRLLSPLRALQETRLCPRCLSGDRKELEAEAPEAPGLSGRDEAGAGLRGSPCSLFA